MPQPASAPATSWWHARGRPWRSRCCYARKRGAGVLSARQHSRSPLQSPAVSQLGGMQARRAHPESLLPLWPVQPRPRAPRTEVLPNLEFQAGLSAADRARRCSTASATKRVVNYAAVRSDRGNRARSTHPRRLRSCGPETRGQPCHQVSANAVGSVAVVATATDATAFQGQCPRHGCETSAPISRDAFAMLRSFGLLPDRTRSPRCVPADF